MKHGVMTKADVHAELGKAIAGGKSGRENREEVIVFDSTGTTLQDVAVVLVTLTRVRSSDRSFLQCPHYSRSSPLPCSRNIKSFFFPSPRNVYQRVIFDPYLFYISLKTLASRQATIALSTVETSTST
ncbi:MAG: hypothetical protein ACREBD_23250 [Blastocatellia bacterium]